MPLRFNYCPYCEQKIVFKIEMNDIDSTLYPAPVYIIHKDRSCNKLSTFYLDSKLHVSYKELEKQKSKTKKKIKTIKTLRLGEIKKDKKLLEDFLSKL
ncbi:MAG: hypothetical protein ACFFAN_04790 [Promethearchaeota archaeon]